MPFETSVHAVLPWSQEYRYGQQDMTLEVSSHTRGFPSSHATVSHRVSSSPYPSVSPYYPHPLPVSPPQPRLRARQLLLPPLRLQKRVGVGGLVYQKLDYIVGVALFIRGS
jgi:hypothetical protein